MGGSFIRGEPSTNREQINEYGQAVVGEILRKNCAGAQVAQQVIALARKRDEEGKGEGRRKEEGGRRKKEGGEGRRKKEGGEGSSR
jgi:hypothetical protein